MLPKRAAPKRKASVVDLTDEQDEQSTFKTPKRPAKQLPTPSRTGKSVASSFAIPSSSQPASSPSQPLSISTPISAPRTNSSGLCERDPWLADDDSDDASWNSIIASTQALPESDNGELEWYGDTAAKIVGCRFYIGFATQGERVLIRREPGNPYDSNAIRIDNIQGQQIGHIARQVAAKIAKYIDNGWLVFEGRLTGVIGTFECPIALSAYGPSVTSLAGEEVRERMERDSLALDGYRRRVAEYDHAALAAERKAAAEEQEMPILASSQLGLAGNLGQGDGFAPTKKLFEASQRIEACQLARASDDYGSDEKLLAAMPKAWQPDGISTKMLPYQLQALKWLIDQENPQLPPRNSKAYVQLWRRHESVSGAWTNIATMHSHKSDPVLASGGILADDMGLGKTLEMISLIVQSRNREASNKSDESQATLIVAPLSVMSNWADQIAKHTAKDHQLRVYTYHGSNRKKLTPQEIAEYDVVITTYQTLAMDYMPTKSSKPAPVPRSHGPFSIKWRRIILDEAHYIRNPQSKAAAAATACMARSRWCLTGTPIVNSLKDLFSLVKFIGLSGGLSRLEIFNASLIRPLRAGDSAAADLLHALMKAICLRRRKDMSFIDLRLPALTQEIHRVDFSDSERKKYDALRDEAQGKFAALQHAENNQDRFKKSSQVFEVLLRMRQVCNHWQLCRQRITDLFESLGQSKAVALTPENQRALQDLLQLSIESHEECAICFEHHSPVITTCAHVFGRECISRVIETQKKCPLCRAELLDEACLVEPAHEFGDGDCNDIDTLSFDESSSKLDALLQILQSAAPGTKTVVFSQWTSFLSLVQTRLEDAGLRFCRLDGTMSVRARDAALSSLSNDPECTIMLASLGCCSVGLNLVAANQVVLSDSWWAPAIEDQAVDRVHRLGQTRETKVIRLVMHDTIEERTLEIQKDKRALMGLTLREKASRMPGEATQTRIEDMRRLLE